MGNALALIALLLQYSDKIVQVNKLLATAQAEGRDVSDEELDALFADDDAARDALDEQIALVKANANG